MVKCSAPLCGNSTYRKTPEITFHRILEAVPFAVPNHYMFPKDENLKNAWLIKMNKKNWQPKSSSVLCSKHFESHLMDHSGFRTVLTSSAIPTIFDSSFQENISTPSLKDSVKRKAAIGQGAIGLMDLPNSQPSTSSVIPHYNIPASLQPIQPSSSKSVSEDNVLRVTELNKLKTKNLLKNKKIKAAKQQNRRLKAKVAKFTDIISTLKNKLNHDEVHISSGMQVKNKDFFVRYLYKEIKKSTLEKSFSPELRSFALQLKEIGKFHRVSDPDELN